MGLTLMSYAVNLFIFSMGRLKVDSEPVLIPGYASTLANTADVEVYIGGDKTLTGATKVGEKAAANGAVTLPVKAGTVGQYVIVWFTKLTQDDNGRYRAILGEVEVKS